MQKVKKKIGSSKIIYEDKNGKCAFDFSNNNLAKEKTVNFHICPNCAGQTLRKYSVIRVIECRGFWLL
jgi:hypothetical protein